MRILVADDDGPSRFLIARLLEKRLGHTVTTAGSAKEALDALAVGSPGFDLLITDYQMPGMNGVELLNRIRDDGDAIPAILYSSAPLDTITERCVKEGIRTDRIRHYLCKLYADEPRFLERAIAEATAKG